MLRRRVYLSMSRPITLRFHDHHTFHRSVFWACAAAMITSGMYWLTKDTGFGHWIAAIFAALSLGVVLGLNQTATSRNNEKNNGESGISQPWAQVIRSLLVFVGFSTLILSSGYVAIIGFAVALGAAFATSRGGLCGTTYAVFGGVGSLVGLEVAVRFAQSNQLAAAPGIAVAVISGSSFALVLAAPLAIRHLLIIRDIVTTRYRIVWSQSSGEIQELVGRGFQVWNQAAGLPDEDENRQLLREAVLRLFDTASQWSESTHGKPTSETALREQLESLRQRIESTTDAQAVAEYQQAHDTLNEQLSAMDGIETHRQRVIARLHNYLAAMERLRMAVVSAKSSKASVQAMSSILLADS